MVDFIFAKTRTHIKRTRQAFVKKNFILNLSETCRRVSKIVQRVLYIPHHVPLMITSYMTIG